MINELKKRVEQLMVRVVFSLEEAINEDELSFFIRAMGKNGRIWMFWKS